MYRYYGGTRGTQNMLLRNISIKFSEPWCRNVSSEVFQPCQDKILWHFLTLSVSNVLKLHFNHPHEAFKSETRLQMLCTWSGGHILSPFFFPYIWCNFFSRPWNLFQSEVFESRLQRAFECRVKVVIRVWGIIMENPQEPSFFEATLNLSPVSVFLSVSFLYSSLWILHPLPPIGLLCLSAPGSIKGFWMVVC